MVTSKAQGQMQLVSNYELSTEMCLLARSVVGSLGNRLFHIFLFIMLTRPRKVDKHEVLGRLKNDIYKIINTYSETSKEESPRTSVIYYGRRLIIVNLSNRSRNARTRRNSIFEPSEYANYCDRFLNWLELLEGM